MQHITNNFNTQLIMLSQKCLPLNHDILLDCQQALDCIIYDRIDSRKRTFSSNNLIYRPNSIFVCDAILANYTATEISQMRDHV